MWFKSFEDRKFYQFEYGKFDQNVRGMDSKLFQMSTALLGDIYYSWKRTKINGAMEKQTALKRIQYE